MVSVYVLLAHKVVISLGGVVEGTRVVDGARGAWLGEVGVVAGDEGLLCDAHFVFLLIDRRILKNKLCD